MRLGNFELCRCLADTYTFTASSGTEEWLAEFPENGYCREKGSWLEESGTLRRISRGGPPAILVRMGLTICLIVQNKCSKLGSTYIRHEWVMFSLSLILKPRAVLCVIVNDAKKIILRFHLPSVCLVQRS